MLVSKPLVPKNANGPLRVLIVGRISTIHQNVQNIDASYRYVEGFLKHQYTGPLEIKHLGEQASGMRTDRATIIEAEEEIATRTWDLVITEDLSRFYRNPRHQYAFVQDAVDNDTRVICIGDNLDTADDNWEVSMMTATVRHGLHIPDTRRRVRRTATDSFHRGGMVLRFHFGYRKLTKEEAASGEFGPKGLRLAKIPDHTPAIRHMKDMIVQRRASLIAVADWLNDEGIKPGPYVKKGGWTARIVANFLRDPILSGTRTFRDLLYEPIFRTGRHKVRRNPNGPETEHYPELAHISQEEQAELISVLATYSKNRSVKRGLESPLHNRPRSRSPWPGQHMHCGICGGLFYWGEGHLKCENAFAVSHDPCWNHVQVGADQAREKVIGWLMDIAANIPAFRTVLLESAQREYEKTLNRSQRNEASLDGQIRSLESQASNLAKAIAAGGQLPSLLEQLAEIESALTAQRLRKAEEANSHQGCAQFVTSEYLDKNLDSALLHLASSSYDFADLMRRLIPEFVIYPVQPLDSGLVRPRARITLRLSALADGPASPGSVKQDVTASIDLFEPPEHIRHMPACVQAKARCPELSLKKIATSLGINYMTVKRALNYARLMEREGITNPYRELRDRPEQASRWKRRAS
jgi:DNA invertase Pin-like site-specific DNA recombinase